MGMAASSLRFAQLTARKNQVEFEGQQINQQRLTLSQKSTALFNDMLTKQVPTAPDPSAFTRIVYKFNNGFGESSILNLARKSSGAYNYNVTYKRPKTTKTLSRSSFSNVGFTTTLGVTTSDKTKASYYARTANVDGVSRNLTLVGGDSAAAKLQTYRDKLETYNNMKTIEEQIRSLSNKNGSDACESSTQQNIKNALGLKYNTNGDGQNKISKALKQFAIEPAGFNASFITEPVGFNASYMIEPSIPQEITDVALNGIETSYSNKRKAAHIMTRILRSPNDVQDSDFAPDVNKQFNSALFQVLNSGKASDSIKNALGFSDGDSSVNVFTKPPEQLTDIRDNETITNLNDLQKKELANLLAEYANNENVTNIASTALVNNTQHTEYTQQLTNHQKYLGDKQAWDNHKTYLDNKQAWDNYTNYGQAANSLYNLANGQAADDTVTNEQMVEMLNALLKEVGENCTSSGDYKTKKVDPAFAQYQSATATAGIVNIAAGQILYEYQDDEGQKCYMYVSNENVIDDTSSTYAEQVSVYENVLNYLEGEMETESQDANVIMSDEGQVAKITFADGTVVTPEVVTEMDNDA